MEETGGEEIGGRGRQSGSLLLLQKEAITISEGYELPVKK